MATSNTQPPDNDKKAREALRKIQERMQGYKEPVPDTREPDPPGEVPLNKQSTTNQPAISEPVDEPRQEPEPVVDADPEPTSKYNISPDLMARFAVAQGVEGDRYRSRPWRQLPNETAIEYALFSEYLKPPMARGRDLESLASRLNAPELADWYPQLLSTLPVPKYVIDGFDVKGKVTARTKKQPGTDSNTIATADIEAMTRALWWLSERNYWPERSRLYDAWQMDTLAGERKLQIQQFAQEMHSHYVNHAYEMLAVLKETRTGLADGLQKAKGRLNKLTEVQKMPPTDDNPMFIERTIEWDPVAQIEAMHKITDRLFGPLPNMLDGNVSTVLDQSLSLPLTKPGASVDGDDDLTDGIPEKKRTNAPWMIERLTKVQAAMEKRKLIEAPVQTEGGGDNEKPLGVK